MALTTFNKLETIDQYRVLAPIVKKTALSLKNALELIVRNDPIVRIRKAKPPIIVTPLPQVLSNNAITYEAESNH